MSRTHYFDRDGVTYVYSWEDGCAVLQDAWSTKEGEKNAQAPSILSTVPTEKQEEIENEITATCYYDDHQGD